MVFQKLKARFNKNLKISTIVIFQKKYTSGIYGETIIQQCTAKLICLPIFDNDGNCFSIGLKDFEIRILACVKLITESTDSKKSEQIQLIIDEIKLIY